MLELVSVFWDIVLLRRGPRDLPASIGVLGAVAAIYLAASIATARIELSPELALLSGLLDLGMVVGVFSALLAVRHRSHRLPQTLTALLGAGLVLTVPNAALAIAAHGHALPDSLVAAVHLAFILLLVWDVIVTGHIVRAALDVPLFTAIAVAMSYEAISMLVLLQLPTPPAS